MKRSSSLCRNECVAWEPGVADDTKKCCAGGRMGGDMEGRGSRVDGAIGAGAGEAGGCEWECGRRYGMGPAETGGGAVLER